MKYPLGQVHEVIRKNQICAENFNLSKKELNSDKEGRVTFGVSKFGYEVRAVELCPKIIFLATAQHSTTTSLTMAAPVPIDRLPPTTTAYVIATAIIAGVTGYFIGQGASLNLFKEKNEGWPNSYNVKVHSHSSDEEDSEEEETDQEDSEDEGNGEELASFKDNTEEVKLVLVVRMDLGMTKGMRSTNIALRTC